MNAKKEAITYVIFGLLTTAVDAIVYFTWTQIFGEKSYAVANILAFIAAVSFAYVTNKLFVFESKSWKAEILKKEIPPFLAARIVSFIIGHFGLIFAGEVLLLGQKTLHLFVFTTSWLIVAKLSLQVIIIIMNYVFSKFFVFKKNREI